MPASEKEQQERRAVVAMTGITKSFGPVRVLEEVDFSVYPGEVHILAGENGAGKSTLIKILGGVYSDWEGSITLEGRPIRPSSPHEAARLGVAVIHQELSLVPSMRVVDNLFLGRPLVRQGFIRERLQKAEAAAALSSVGVDLDVEELIEQLPISVQQLVEIAKAVRLNAKVIVMDEPSSALNAHDVETLFSWVRQLKEQNRAIVYITHRMEEIHRIADRITVLRDGRLVGTDVAANLSDRRIITWMVGREVDWEFVRSRRSTTKEALRVEELTIHGVTRSRKPAVERVSFAVRAGEILGIGGLQGSGASDLVFGLFGALKGRVEGRVLLDGRPVSIRSPRDAIRRGISLLTNDRKATGLMLSMSIVANLCIADLGRLTRLGWRLPGREKRAADSLAKALSIRASSLEMEVADLSGGNQQKVAIGKWLQTSPRVLLLDEPTRGIDVAAKHEIHRLMDEWTAQGIAIVLITSEMPELLSLSDRIIVLHRGVVAAELPAEAATAEAVLEAAMGSVNQRNGN